MSNASDVSREKRDGEEAQGGCTTPGDSNRLATGVRGRSLREPRRRFPHSFCFLRFLTKKERKRKSEPLAWHGEMPAIAGPIVLGVVFDWCHVRPVRVHTGRQTILSRPLSFHADYEARSVTDLCTELMVTMRHFDGPCIKLMLNTDAARPLFDPRAAQMTICAARGVCRRTSIVKNAREAL